MSEQLKWPVDWNLTDLASVASVTDPHPSHRAPEEDFGGIPFAGIGDLDEYGNLRRNKVRLVSACIYDEHITRYKISSNTIGFGRVASIGKVIDFKEFSEKVTVSPTMAIIEPKNIDKKFLVNVLKTDDIAEQIKLLLTGSTRSSLGISLLRELELPFPLAPEQQKIAKILTSVDEVIEKTQAQIDKVKDLKTGMMQELLTQGVGVDGKPHTEFKDSPAGRIPKAWKVAKLESVAVIQTGAAKSSKLEGDLIELPYLRVANVQDGYLDLKEIKTIKIPKSKSERFLLRENDVLVNEGGDFDKLGRGSIWFGQISPCAHQNHVFAVRTNINKLSPSFFNHLSGAEYGKKYYLGCAKQTTNLASINSTQLKQFPVLLPSIEEQVRICAMLDSVDLRISKQESKLRHLESLKKALMQDLLTGKVRVAID